MFHIQKDEYHILLVLGPCYKELNVLDVKLMVGSQSQGQQQNNQQQGNQQQRQAPQQFNNQMSQAPQTMANAVVDEQIPF